MLTQIYRLAILLISDPIYCTGYEVKVNISPSLHSGTPLDVSVKAPLAKDVLNMAGIYVPPRFAYIDLCFLLFVFSTPLQP